ncbi:TRAP transporter permease [Actinoplanes sp. NPDC004185]
MVDRRYRTGRTAADEGPDGPPSAVAEHRPPDSPLADPAAVHFDDEERPARALTGSVGMAVAVVAFAAALLVLWQVFRPLAQGSQFYLIIFLAGTLPLVFLVYRSGFPPRKTNQPDGIAAGPDRESVQLDGDAARRDWESVQSDGDAARPDREPAQLDGMTARPDRKPAQPNGMTARRDLPSPLDWALAVLTLLVCLYPVNPFNGGYNEFLNRQGLLETPDVIAGAVMLVLVVEACRRTTGLALPIVCLAFLAYGYYGGLLPQNWSIAHSGLDFAQIVDALCNSGSGFYGTPLDVAATYIVLFTIYGAVLDLSGASRFFVDLSVAAFRKSRSAAGRTAVAAGFLLGTVSGSGTATAVSVGAVTWPMLRRAGYPAEQAGGMLAAAGVGAILSPPTLGAAAFIVAEYLDVSYLTVLGWAMIPTVLYYLGILLAVEIDVRRFQVRPIDPPATSAWRLLGRFGYHFSSLVLIVLLLAVGQSATRAVVYATLLAAVLSFLDRRAWLTPRRLFAALSAGVRGVLPVVAVCAAAGIITATTTKTGLGAQLASLLIDGARAVSDNQTVVLALTVVLAAVALAVLGLAVPVTASFIIGWVIIGPALLALGVSAPAAAMFVFYYSVLSEVTPPTALAAVGASAITGGRTVPTMWQTLKYALPAFLAPIAFVLTDPGEYLLARGPVTGIVWATGVAALAVLGLAVATGGWVPGIGAAGPASRVLGGVAGLLLLYLAPLTIAAGAVALALAAGIAIIDRTGRITS